MDASTVAELEAYLDNEDYVSIIAKVRDLVAEDSAVFTHEFVKNWCAMRWRNLFLNEAVSDVQALKKSDRSKLVGRRDKRPAKQKIAEQFLKGDEMREWSIDMPSFEKPEQPLTTTLVFSPGLLNGMLPVRAFQTAFPKIEEELNIRVLRADNHPMRGCKENIEDLVAAIEQGAGLRANTEEISEEEREAPGDVFLIGYSKGAPDIYEMLAARPDLKDRIRCIFNWGGAVGGSYLANDIYRSIENLDIPKVEGALARFLSLISPAINMQNGTFRRIEEYNIKEAVYDLTTHAREAFFKEHSASINAMGLPIFNITGATTAMEVPYFQMQGVMELNRYDANNDMQLTQSQAKFKVPMATDLAMLRAHHWDMSYDAFPKLMRFGSPNLDHPFPKEAGMKAMIMLAIELGLVD